MDTRVRVVIVNFNAGHLLEDCVRAVLATPVPLDVVVVDNASSDGSLEPLRQTGLAGLTLIENTANTGFAKACNRALKDWHGEFALLLNPDCRVEADTIPGMLAAFSAAPESGMAGCLIRNPDGSEQPGCRRLTPTPARLLGALTGRGGINLAGTPMPDGPVAVEAISGAFMLVRRTAVEQVGLLDENYFMHWEDLDWCYRFRRAGWPILFVPGLSVTHVKGACSRRSAIRVEWHKHAGMVRYYEKFFRDAYPRPLMWLMYVGVWLRFALKLPTAAMRSVGAV